MYIYLYIYISTRGGYPILIKQEVQHELLETTKSTIVRLTPKWYAL